MNEASPARKGPRLGVLIAVVVALAAGAGYLSQRHLRGAAPAATTAVATAPPASPAAPPSTAAAPGTASADAQRPVPEVLPGFSLQDRDGKPRTLAEWKGQPLVVNFWATWCAPCRREIPLLNQVRAARKAQRLEVIGIAVDFREDVLAYVKQRPIDYPLLIGEEDGLEALKSVGMSAAFPFSLFADSRQRIVALKVGELHADELDLILDRIRDVDSGQLDLPGARAQISDGLKELATKRALKAASAPKA
jgi:thiol-disulfide isomerase/thioredoxin